MQLHWVVDLHRQTIQRAAGGERKANCKHQCAPTLPEGNRLRGIDAPTPARTVGLPPRRGTYFLSKRKKVPKKAGGTATTGKRLLLPILTAGLAMSRAMELDSYHLRFERARAHLFPPSKWAAFFPALPNAARLPRRWRGAYSKGCQLGYCIAACAFSQHRKRDLILSIDFLQRKRPAGFYIHAGLYCEP